MEDTMTSLSNIKALQALPQIDKGRTEMCVRKGSVSNGLGPADISLSHCLPGLVVV